MYEVRGCRTNTCCPRSARFCGTGRPPVPLHDAVPAVSLGLTCCSHRWSRTHGSRDEPDIWHRSRLTRDRHLYAPQHDPDEWQPASGTRPGTGALCAGRMRERGTLSCQLSCISLAMSSSGKSLGSWYCAASRSSVARLAARRRSLLSAASGTGHPGMTVPRRTASRTRKAVPSSSDTRLPAVLECATPMSSAAAFAVVCVVSNGGVQGPAPGP